MVVWINLIMKKAEMMCKGIEPGATKYEGWKAQLNLLRKGHSRPLFLYFRLFNSVESKQYSIKTFPLTGFKLRTSGARSDSFAKWPATTALGSPLVTISYIKISFAILVRVGLNKSGFRKCRRNLQKWNLLRLDANLGPVCKMFSAKSIACINCCKIKILEIMAETNL